MFVIPEWLIRSVPATPSDYRARGMRRLNEKADFAANREMPRKGV